MSTTADTSSASTPADSPLHAQRPTLEYWLSRATDPYVGEGIRAEHLHGFHEQVNEELEGPQIATRLLAHKIQSPFEVEALHALDSKREGRKLKALDACMKNCGLRFHNEVAKFRFLNELIRILSPKYLGAQTSERVKQRTVELMYGWKRSMPHMGKISQAYDMLKHQGIIHGDPTYMDQVLEAQPPPPVPQPRTASFEDQEKSRLLAELLASKRPEDLMAANRLIKSMVKAEDQKMEKMAKRGGDLETAESNAKLLADMVTQFKPHQSSSTDVDIMKDLVSSLTTLRPGLFRYAGEAAEGEEAALARVLAVNDEVSKAIDEYKARVEPHAGESTPTTSAPISQRQNIQNLLDGLDLTGDTLPCSGSDHSVAASDDVGMIGGGITPVMARKPLSVASGGSGLDDLLGPDPFPGSNPTSSIQPKDQPIPKDLEALLASVKSAQAASVAVEEKKSVALGRDLLSERDPGLGALDQLSDSLILQSLGKASTAHTQRNLMEQRQKVPLRDIQGNTSPAKSLPSPSLSPTPARPSPPPQEPKSPQKSPQPPKSPQREKTNGNDSIPEKSENGPSAESGRPLPGRLEGVSVAMEDILPGNREPMTVVDKKGLKVVVHLAGNAVGAGVGVLVIHISSSLPTRLKEVALTLAPATPALGVRVEAPTAISLPPPNPILPPSAITQIVYLSLPNKGGVELDFTLDFEVDGSERSIAGSFQLDASHFPS